MARKTIAVETLRDYVNNAMDVTARDMTAERMALATMLERVLLDTGNYRGFRYLDMAADETRRYYF